LISSSLLYGATVVEVVVVGFLYTRYGLPTGGLQNGLGFPILNPLFLKTI
jgi:hypothetical protein